MKRFFTMLMVPVMGIALSLAVLPTVAKADETTDSSKAKKKKKKKDSGTGQHTSVAASN